MLPKRRRLTKEREFFSVFQRGKVYHSQPLVLRVLLQGTEETRFGFTVSKKVGTAVVRNRVKRRLREIVRVARTNPGWDVVIASRKQAAYISFSELSRIVINLLHNAGILYSDDLEVPLSGE